MPVALNGTGGGGGGTRSLSRGFQGFLRERQFLTEARLENQATRTARVQKTITARKTAAATLTSPVRAAISLEPLLPRAPGAVSGTKLAELECRARGGVMVLGRCVFLAPRPAPAPTPVESRVEGGPVMGIRAQLISPGFLPTGGQTSVLGGLIQGGLDIVNQFVAAKFGATGVGSPSPTPVAVQTLGGLIPTGGPVGLAAISAVVVAAGGAIVGTVIRISSRAWAAIPALVKQAAIALGLTVAFTDIGLDLPGGGDGLSQAQQRKVDRFQQLTGAGVPPGIAARATGIGRRRRRGISAFELSGFRKISHLLGHVGMVPRGLRGARPSRGHHHHK